MLEAYANYSFSIDATSAQMLIDVRDNSILDNGLYCFYTQVATANKRYKQQLLCKVQYDAAGEIACNASRTGVNNQLNWPTCDSADRSNQY
mgnify:CR=1 FL=1